MKPLPKLWQALISVLVAVLLLVLPGLSRAGWFEGLTVEKEKQLGEEFLLELQQYYVLVTDPFLTSYLNRVGQKLVAQMGPQPYNFRFFILQDPSINAFAVPGGYIFISTGMIQLMDQEDELAGVLAHEASHIYRRHMARQMEKAKITTISGLVGALAGIFLGPAGAPLMVGSMAAGQTAMLKYSRDFEREADSFAFKWLVKANYNPRGLVSIFKKMNRQRWFEGGDIPVYLSTHPDLDSRVVNLQHQCSHYQGQLPVGHNNPEFQYFTIKLGATCGNPGQMLRWMTKESAQEPQNPAYHYGRALALARLEHSEEALAAFQQALKLAPGNYLIQRDLAIHYFDCNRYSEALKLLEELARRQPQDGVVLYYLGRISQERKQFDQALALFERVHTLNPTFIEVYYNLGTLYGETGKLGLAHYYLGFHSLRAKALPTALFHFRKALQYLPSSDLHYLEVKRQVARLEKMRVRVR
jgi:predicted Zn-dependent protease